MTTTTAGAGAPKIDDRLVEGFPLQWPSGRPRTPSHKRRAAYFGKRRDTFPKVRDLSVADACERLSGELRRLGAVYWTLTSNLRLRRDGLPYAGQPQPEDPGASVFFRVGDQQYALAADRWDRVADNIAAIAATIDALRGIDRWGVQTTSEAFAGARYLLPAPAPEWVEVLGERPGGGVPRTRAEARAAYRERARLLHPDAGGDADDFVRLRAALQEAEAALPDDPKAE